MDSFNYMVTVVLMMLVMQFGESWMAFGILIISILSSKDFPTILLLLISGGILYFSNAMGLFDFWPIILIALLGLSFVLGSGKGGGGQPEYYNPDPFGGLMGGGV